MLAWIMQGYSSKKNRHPKKSANMQGSKEAITLFLQPFSLYDKPHFCVGFPLLPGRFCSHEASDIKTAEEFFRRCPEGGRMRLERWVHCGTVD